MTTGSLERASDLLLDDRACPSSSLEQRARQLRRKPQQRHALMAMILLAGVIVLAAVSLTKLHSQHSSVTVRTQKAPSSASLPLAIATALTNESLDPTTIASGYYVSTTRAHANEKTNESSGGDSPVYLVVLEGSFQQEVSGPAGPVAVTGTEVTLVVDAATSNVTDYGLHSSPIDASDLGPQIPLDMNVVNPLVSAH